MSSYVYETTLRNGQKYIGSRRSPCANPYKDIKYFGSPTHRKDWEPVSKRIVAIFTEHKHALALEVHLHAYYDVARNPLYYNRANQTSSGFISYNNYRRRLWFHPKHGEFVGSTTELVRAFPDRNYQNANLTRIARGRQKSSYRGWQHLFTFECEAN